MSYTHLSFEERHCLELDRKTGTSMNKIAGVLERSQSTLSSKLSRNSGQRGYLHQQANNLAISCQKRKTKYIQLTEKLK